MVSLDNQVIINKQYVINSYEILYINLKKVFTISSGCARHIPVYVYIYV